MARAKHSLGLDKPLMVQYEHLHRASSSTATGAPARARATRSRSMIGPAMQNTLQLIIPGIIISLILAVTLGIYSAVTQYSVGRLPVHRACPSWASPCLRSGSACWPSSSWPSSPSSGSAWPTPRSTSSGLHTPGQSGVNVDYFQHLLLPVLTLTIQSIAEWSRYQRASMLDVMSLDYVRTATAKGVPRRTGGREARLPQRAHPAGVGGRHRHRRLFGGLSSPSRSSPSRAWARCSSTPSTPVTPRCSWCGLLVTAFFVILFNLIADLAYGVLDPRVRLA